MRKSLLSLFSLLAVVAAWAQESNTSWAVGSAANDKANITWIGFEVPTVDDEGNSVTEVSLNNIHLCTNKNDSGEKTAYMVISSTTDVNGRIGVSMNNPEPLNNALVEYKFKDVTLRAGATYYMLFSVSNTNIVSCGQRIAIDNANGDYAPMVSGNKWRPYFKINPPTRWLSLLSFRQHMARNGCV